MLWVAVVVCALALASMQGRAELVLENLVLRQLYGFVVLEHGRRRIRHVAVTAHPTAEWASQQLREAFPWDTAPRFLHRDRDGIYGNAGTATMGIEEVLSAPRSPWQNAY